jgi:hypothetical protein
MIKNILKKITRDKSVSATVQAVTENTSSDSFQRPYFKAEVCKYDPGKNIYSKAAGIPHLGFGLCRLNKKEPKCSPTGNWFSCREIFAGSFTKVTSQFFFGVSNFAECQSIAYFFMEVEKRLGITDNVCIQPTDYNNLVIIHIPKWWRANYARRQLFTILLRCGVYYAASFEEALKAVNYSSATLKAVNKFLEGNTYVRRGGDNQIAANGGWYNTFNGGKNLDILIDKDKHYKIAAK